jgi:type I restriction enzyme R subunit
VGLTPEQLARQKIDALLDAAGWKVQSMRELNLGAGLSVAVRKFQTASVPIEYVLFLDRKVMGILDHVLEKM